MTSSKQIAQVHFTHPRILMKIASFAVVSLLLLLFIQPGTAIAADGKALLEQKCVLCHTLERVEAKGASKPVEADWAAVVDRMKSKGCPVTDQEKTDIVTYLTTTYSGGAAPTPAAPTAAPASPSATTATTVPPTTAAAPDAATSTPAKTAAEDDPAATATPSEQAQTGAEDWIFPLLGACMIAAGVRMRRVA